MRASAIRWRSRESWIERCVPARCQTEVVVRTSYADRSTYSFSRVFPPPSPPLDDIFKSVLPVVLDCVNGINGAVLVRGAESITVFPPNCHRHVPSRAGSPVLRRLWHG